jgi:hypothetical protein
MDSGEFRAVVAPTLRLHLAANGSYPTSAGTVREGAGFLRKGGDPAVLAGLIVGTSEAGRMESIPFVNRVFENIHRRKPNLVELTNAVHSLQTGTSRGQLIASWTASEAGATALAPQVDVAMTYLGMLDRTPDAAGWAHWVPRARQGSIEALIAGFQTSAEYRQRVTAPAVQ